MRVEQHDLRGARHLQRHRPAAGAREAGDIKRASVLKPSASSPACWNAGAAAPSLPPPLLPRRPASGSDAPEAQRRRGPQQQRRHGAGHEEQCVAGHAERQDWRGRCGGGLAHVVEEEAEQQEAGSEAAALEAVGQRGGAAHSLVRRGPSPLQQRAAAVQRRNGIHPDGGGGKHYMVQPLPDAPHKRPAGCGRARGEGGGVAWPAAAAVAPVPRPFPTRAPQGCRPGAPPKTPCPHQGDHVNGHPGAPVRERLKARLERARWAERQPRHDVWFWWKVERQTHAAHDGLPCQRAHVAGTPGAAEDSDFAPFPPVSPFRPPAPDCQLPQH